MLDDPSFNARSDQSASYFPILIEGDRPTPTLPTGMPDKWPEIGLFSEQDLKFARLQILYPQRQSQRDLLENPIQRCQNNHRYDYDGYRSLLC